MVLTRGTREKLKLREFLFLGIRSLSMSKEIETETEIEIEIQIESESERGHHREKVVLGITAWIVSEGTVRARADEGGMRLMTRVAASMTFREGGYLAMLAVALLIGVGVRWSHVDMRMDDVGWRGGWTGRDKGWKQGVWRSGGGVVSRYSGPEMEEADRRRHRRRI